MTDVDSGGGIVAAAPRRRPPSRCRFHGRTFAALDRSGFREDAPIAAQAKLGGVCGSGAVVADAFVGDGTSRAESTPRLERPNRNGRETCKHFSPETAHCL